MSNGMRARVAVVVLPEHGADRRRERLDVRHHHDDVARPQRRRRVARREHRQQRIVKDLDLALRAVRDMEHDRAVVARHDPVLVLGHRHEVADRRLHLAEQRRRPARRRSSRRSACRSTGARFASSNTSSRRMKSRPCRPHAASSGCACRCISSSGTAPRSTPCFAGCRGVAARSASRPSRISAQWKRQGFGTASTTSIRVDSAASASSVCGARCDAPNSTTRRGRPANDAAGSASASTKARWMSGRGASRRARTSSIERAPQLGLPALAVRHRRRRPVGGRERRATRRPRDEPVAPVHLVLIVEPREAAREAETAGRFAVTEELGHRRERGAVEQRRQQAHQSPRQQLAVERRLLRHAVRTEHAANHPPQEATRQLEAHRGADPVGRRERELQPFGGAVARREDDLLVERVQRLAREPVEHDVPKRLETIAVQDQQAGRGGGGHAGGREGRDSTGDRRGRSGRSGGACRDEGPFDANGRLAARGADRTSVGTAHGISRPPMPALVGLSQCAGTRRLRFLAPSTTDAGPRRPTITRGGQA